MALPIPNSVRKDQTKVNFRISHKRLKSYYISSIPQGLNLVSVREFKKPKPRGEANGFIFYEESFRYISARFNLNDSKVDEAEFLQRIKIMFSTLQYLNKKPTRPINMILILEHIRKYSNYVFDVRELFLKVCSFKYDHSLVKGMTRDYTIKEYAVYEEKIDFLNAFNEAHKVVNSNFNLKELFYLLEERITNNDYGYINEAIIIGHRDNNLLVYAMVRKFNLLCTGLQRKERKQVKSEPLYCNSIKRLTLRSISFKPQQQNAFMQKGILQYERELKAFNRLINNRKIAQQMLLILGNLTGLDIILEIIPDEEAQNQLKAELINLIHRKASVDLTAEAIEFDIIYKKPICKDLSPYTDISDVFDTDMTNSIFNQVSMDEAFFNGAEFFIDYLLFHDYQKKTA